MTNEERKAIEKTKIEDMFFDAVFLDVDESYRRVHSFTWFGKYFYKQDWERALASFQEALKEAKALRDRTATMDINPFNRSMLDMMIETYGEILTSLLPPPKEEWERTYGDY